MNYLLEALCKKCQASRFAERPLFYDGIFALGLGG